MSQSLRHVEVYWKPEGMSLSAHQSRTKFSRLKHSGVTRAFCAETRWAKKIFSPCAAMYLAVDASGGNGRERYGLVLFPISSRRRATPLPHINFAN